MCLPIRIRLAMLRLGESDADNWPHRSNQPRDCVALRAQTFAAYSYTIRRKKNEH